MGDRERIDWREDYRARAPNGEIVEAPTQSQLVEAIDEHGKAHGIRNQVYTVEREGYIEPSYEG